MKKVILVLAAALLLSGAAWGQLGGVTLPDLSDYQIFNWYQANVGVSTESGTSAGVFTSDVDNYIDPMSYNPEIGTFVYFGGHNMSYLGTNMVSFGFAKTLSNGYLGLYFGGRPVDAEGETAEKYERSSANWYNQLAVIFGTKDKGAFRLDLSIGDSEAPDSVENEYETDGDGKKASETIRGPTIGIT